VSSLCPSDTNKIAKRHSSLRFDTTIAGFEKMRWIRGSLSFLIPGNKDPEGLRFLTKKYKNNDNNKCSTKIDLELESLSTSEMKDHLESLGLSHSDCIEKSDLLNKLKRYYNTQEMKNSKYRTNALKNLPFVIT
jgi:hypothetical protein